MPRPNGQRYDSDLTDAQWQTIEPLVQHQCLRRHTLRDVFNALFYITKGGGQWQMLPDSYPPWQTVYGRAYARPHLRRWTTSGLIAGVNHALREAVRRKAGRDPSPSAAVIDSQSVKTTHVGGVRSFDGGKKVNGRKRHILTDTLGLLLAVLVHPAGIHDSQRVPHLLDRVQGLVPRLRVVFADQGYAATPTGLIWRVFGWLLHIVERDPDQKGFVVVKKRWVVERTFAWLGLYRRLSKDYEVLPEVSEAMVLLASIRLMARRLA